MPSNTLNYLHFTLVTIISLIILFYDLGNNAMLLWDESRVAVKSYEMMNNHEFIVPHFEGSPDMWSVKPPLVLWMQVGAIKVLGFHEFSVRFPSAFMAFGTCLMLFLFCVFYFKNSWIGLWAVLILITTRGYIEFHVARHADYDAPLIFFLTLSTLSWFLYIESTPKHPTYVWISSISTGLAIFCKSVAGAFFLPGLLLYTLFSGQLSIILRKRTFWFALATGVSIFLWHYLLREYLNPGYFDSLKNIQMGRITDLKAPNSDNPFFFINNIVTDFYPWIIFLPLSIGGFFLAHAFKKRLGAFILLNCLILIVIISLNKARHDWYEAPIYPLLSLAVALGMHELISRIIDFYKVKRRATVVLGVLTMVTFVYPLVLSWKRIDNYKIIRHIPDAQYGEFINNKSLPDTLYIYHNSYNATIAFYNYKYVENNILSKPPSHPTVGDTALICEDHFKAITREEAYLSIIDSLYNCILCKVDSLKDKDLLTDNK